MAHQKLADLIQGLIVFRDEHPFWRHGKFWRQKASKKGFQIVALSLPSSY